MARSSVRTRAAAAEQRARAAALASSGDNGGRSEREAGRAQGRQSGAGAGAGAGAGTGTGTPSRWRQPLCFGLSAAALGVSIYLTVLHYTSTAPGFCPSTGVINCRKVLTSEWSVIFGVPVAVIGLAYYVVMFLLNTPFAWRMKQAWVTQLRVVAVVAGMPMVLYLLYVELFDVKAICEYCTSVHIITFVLFILIVTGWDDMVAHRGAAKVRRFRSRSRGAVEVDTGPEPEAA